MAELESTGFISLQDLAGMNTDDIKALASRVAAPGIFRVRGLTVNMKQGEPSDDGKPGIFNLTYNFEILSAQPTDKSVDPENLVGKKINERFAIFPQDLVEGIGLLKGKYQKVGLPFSGMPMGGLEGAEPGWVDTVVNAEFDVRIRNAPGKDGQLRAFFDWLPPKKEAEVEA
jgi:hypothetical protein